MLPHKKALIILILAMLLSACSSIMLPGPVIAAQKMLALTLGLQQEKVEIGSYEVKEWTDSCMGAAKEGELCAQVITDGFKVTMRAEGKYYEVHANQDGSLIKILP